MMWNKISSTIKFREVWSSYDEFESEYKQSFAVGTLTDENLKILYWLLYGQHANDHIINYDVAQWKVKLYSIIFQYGPSWERRLQIQKSLRELTDDEIRIGVKSVYNNAQNPGNIPNDLSLEELNYINNQNVSKVQKGKLDAYETLYETIRNDVTSGFLNMFKKLFKNVLMEKPIWYSEEE